MTEEANSVPTPGAAAGAEPPEARQLRARLEVMDKNALVQHAIAQEDRIWALRWTLECDDLREHPGSYVVEEFTRNYLPADLLFAGPSGDDLTPLTRIAGQQVTVGMLFQALRGDL